MVKKRIKEREKGEKNVIATNFLLHVGFFLFLFKYIVTSMQDYAADTIIFNEMDLGDEFYIISHGEVEILTQNPVLGGPEASDFNAVQLSILSAGKNKKDSLQS